MTGSAFAQSQASARVHTIPEFHSKQHSLTKDSNTYSAKQNSAISSMSTFGSATSIWSEDFSNGIPSTWINQGYSVDPVTGNFTASALCNWEYRGPNTTPTITTGSRGAFSIVNGPMASPSVGNGFVIFDSGYLDNNGSTSGIGNGSVPAPHYGTLTTDIIDLSGFANVQLTINSYAKEFLANLQVAISGDGGLTFPDTIMAVDLAINAVSANPEFISLNISNTAGNSANVVLQFIFDGRPSNANAAGYYFWMLDDLEISEIIGNSFQFVEDNGAQANNVLYPNGHPVYGNPQLAQVQAMPINFSANIWNFGFSDQYNVRLNVDVIDDNGSVVTTFQSGAKAILNSGDTGTYTDFTTSNSWTPGSVGDFDAVYYVTSDSTNAATPFDTISFSINNALHGGHFNSLDNVMGTSNGALALAQAFTFPASFGVSGFVAIEGISTFIDGNSDTTGSIIVEIYDTTGFSYGAGGGPSGSPLVVETFPLNSSVVGQTAFIDLTNNGNPLLLTSNKGYLIILNLVTTSGNISIGNDQTIKQSPPLIGMLANDGSWYSGFSNSRTLSNLMINVVLSTQCLPPANLGVSNITTNSADIFWNGTGLSSMYNVQYGLQGFALGTGTILSTSNDSLSLTGISPSLCYEFWVQSICGNGDTSVYVGPFAFCTQCNVLTSFPYIENFSSAPVTNIPACYLETSTNPNGTFSWRVVVGGTPSSDTGPDSDADGSILGNYVYTEASSPAALGDSAFLYLPNFDLSSRGIPELVFAYHMYGAQITTLNVQYFDTNSGNWITINSIAGQQQASSSDPWKELRTDLTSYSSNNLSLRLVHSRGTSFRGDAAIDNIVVRETPFCTDPSGLMVTAVTNNSISITWLSDTTVTSSAIQYGSIGFTLGSGIVISSSVGNSTLSNLMMGACFDIYVLDSCISPTNWVGPVTACTKPACGVSGNPSSVVNDTTVCSSGQVVLSASSGLGMQVAWFLNGQLHGSGSPFTDSISATTTYEVRNVSRDGSNYNLGPDPNVAGGGFGNFTNGQYITVLDTLIIDSTTVRSNGAVVAQVIITDGLSVTDGGNILQRGRVFSTPAGPPVDTQVAVGILLIPGQYFIGIDFLPASSGQLFRSTGGAVYPYSLLGMMTIDSVNFAGPRYYYTFDLVVRNACIASSGVPAIGYLREANAGASDSVIQCHTNNSIDLTQFLGSYDFGGTWLDNDSTGALTDSIFDATSMAIPGPYSFSYVLTQSGICTSSDTATLIVSLDSTVFAGNDTTSLVCTADNPFQLLSLLPGSDAGGTISDLDSSGGITGNTLFDPGSVVNAGIYRFQYHVISKGCPNDSAMITLQVEDAVNAGADSADNIVDCTIPIDLNNYLSAGATAGGTWIDLSSSGALVGSIFSPNTTLIGTYDFRYLLSSFCGDDSSAFAIYVDCTIGLDEYRIKSFNIYPNPTNGTIRVEAIDLSDKINRFEIYSSNGALLYEQHVDNHGVQIQLNKFVAGLYQLSIWTDEGVQTYKIYKL